MLWLWFELAVTSGEEINHKSCDLLRVGSNDLEKNSKSPSTSHKAWLISSASSSTAIITTIDAKPRGPFFKKKLYLFFVLAPTTTSTTSTTVTTDTTATPTPLTAMAATAAAGTVVAVVAGARDATRLEPLVCFFSLSFLLR
jgi:hypothetical protein